MNTKQEISTNKPKHMFKLKITANKSLAAGQRKSSRNKVSATGIKVS